MNTPVTLESVAKTLIINERNEALVLTVGEYEGRPDKSHQPDLPGGIVETHMGEVERAGAIREAEEEAGLVLRPENMQLGYVKTEFYEEQLKSVSKFLYVTHIKNNDEVAISWEHEQYEWIPLETLLSVKRFRPFYQEAIEYVLRNGIA